MKLRLWIPALTAAAIALSALALPVSAASVAAQDLDAAMAAFDAENWTEAAELYRELAAENPDQGKFWYGLAGAEYNLKRYSEAIEAYERAVAVGYQVGTSQYNRACCFALIGEKTAAIDALDLAIRSGLRNREELIRNDTDLVSIRDTPEFRARILPVASPTMSREDGWRMDFAYLTKRVAETHYSPFKHISRAEWDAEIARISAALPSLNDHEVVVALMQLVVRIGDGHTNVFPPREGALGFHVLPLQFYDFKDGLFVRAAHPDYARLVGKRVVRIGKTPAAEALERAATTVQRDNGQQVRWLAPVLLKCTEVLDALGIARGVGAAEITAVDEKGNEIAMSVSSVPIGDMGPHILRNVPSDWIDMAAPVDPAPLWRRDPSRIYTLDYFEEPNVVYANVRMIRDDQNETLEQFGDRMVAFAAERDARALVIDVRVNNGGNNFLGRAFFEAVLKSKYNSDGRLFVIIGRETFSACQNLCNWFDLQTGAMFAGEPTGSKPNFVGEGNDIILPYSGLIANASSRLWQDSVSEDKRVWIAPELAAEMTSDDYRSNRDPAFAAILEYLKTRDLAAKKP